jgi:hypothetical protein
LNSTDRIDGPSPLPQPHSREGFWIFISTRLIGLSRIPSGEEVEVEEKR